MESHLRALRQAMKSRDRARLTQLFEHLIPDYCPALNLEPAHSPSGQSTSFNAVQHSATQSGLSVSIPQVTVTNLP
jgi:hypothetical protein